MAGSRPASVIGSAARRILLEQVGNLTAGRLRARRTDRHVVRLGPRGRQGEGDRDECDRNRKHRDDAGRAQRGRGFVGCGGVMGNSAESEFQRILK
jgi:hypothetical protein